MEAGAPGRISEAGHLIPETIRTIAVVGLSPPFRLLSRFYSVKLICSTHQLIPFYVHINKSKSSTVGRKYFSKDFPLERRLELTGECERGVESAWDCQCLEVA